MSAGASDSRGMYGWTRQICASSARSPESLLSDMALHTARGDHIGEDTTGAAEYLRVNVRHLCVLSRSCLASVAGRHVVAIITTPSRCHNLFPTTASAPFMLHPTLQSIHASCYSSQSGGCNVGDRGHSNDPAGRRARPAKQRVRAAGDGPTEVDPCSTSHATIQVPVCDHPTSCPLTRRTTPIISSSRTGPA